MEVQLDYFKEFKALISRNNNNKTRKTINRMVIRM